jgi:hypothetical protein
MTQALYAHMNNKKIKDLVLKKKIKEILELGGVKQYEECY